MKLWDISCNIFADKCKNHKRVQKSVRQKSYESVLVKNVEADIVQHDGSNLGCGVEVLTIFHFEDICKSSNFRVRQISFQIMLVKS